MALNCINCQTSFQTMRAARLALKLAIGSRYDLLAVLAALMNSELLCRSSGRQQVSETSLQRDLLLMHWHDLQTRQMVRDGLRPYLRVSVVLHPD